MSSRKIIKKGGAKLSPLEKNVALELHNLQNNNEDLKVSGHHH